MTSAKELIEERIQLGEAKVKGEMPTDQDEMGDLWDELEKVATSEKLQGPDFDDSYKKYVQVDFLVDDRDKGEQKRIKAKIIKTVGKYAHKISGPDKEGFISVKLYHNMGAGDRGF